MLLTDGWDVLSANVCTCSYLCVYYPTEPCVPTGGQGSQFEAPMHNQHLRSHNKFLSQLLYELVKHPERQEVVQWRPNACLSWLNRHIWHASWISCETGWKAEVKKLLWLEFQAGCTCLSHSHVRWLLPGSDMRQEEPVRHSWQGDLFWC